MKLTIQQIVDVVQGEAVPASPHVSIEGAAGLEEATSRDISFLSNMKYFDHIYSTKAAAVLIGNKVELDRRVSPILIKVKRPDIAYARILSVIDREKKHREPGIDPWAVISKTALIKEQVYIGPCVIVDENSCIGEGTQIGAGTYIGKHSRIGNNCIIDPRVSILDDVHIGNRVVIKSGSVIGSDGFGFYTQEGRHTKIPQVGSVVIEDDVEIQSLVTIDKGTTDATIIGSGTKIDNMVHIAHNVHIGKNCLLVAHVGISGSTHIGDNVTVGGQAGMAGHLHIGDNSVIAARCGIIGNIPAGSFMAGFPARPYREWKKLQGYISKLPEMYKEFLKKKKN
ncbi:MAG: UDP-3-O-(3-hydroxymyristoyl)glucosamine N-acyltransferase [bacterium]